MGPMLDAIAQEVVSFTEEQFPAMARKLSLETSLQDDLRMDGDDAADFLAVFSKRFGVDLSRLEFQRHFSPEGGINLVSMLFMSGFPSYVPVTIADLVDAATSKVWLEK
jgi:hypothetical protein